MEKIDDLERNLTISEIAEVCVQFLGGFNAVEAVIGRILIDCGADDRDY